MNIILLCLVVSCAIYFVQGSVEPGLPQDQHVQGDEGLDKGLQQDQHVQGDEGLDKGLQQDQHVQGDVGLDKGLQQDQDDTTQSNTKDSSNSNLLSKIMKWLFYMKRLTVRFSREFINKPARKIFNNAKASLEKSKLGEKILFIRKIWDKLYLKGQVRETQIRMLIDILSEEMLNHLPEYTKIEPIEIESTTSYVCGTLGKLEKLPSIQLNKEIEPEVKKMRKGYEIIINYTFTDLHFVFTKFFISVMNVKSYQDTNLDIKFGANNLRLTLKIPELKNIIKKVLQRKCVVYVESFEVTQLDFVESFLTKTKITKEGESRTKPIDGLIGSKVKKSMKEKQTMIQNRFEQRVLIEINRALKSHNHVVCKSDYLVQLVKAKKGSMDSITVSQKFKDSCGEDLYIEPYKRP